MKIREAVAAHQARRPHIVTKRAFLAFMKRITFVIVIMIVMIVVVVVMTVILIMIIMIVMIVMPVSPSMAVVMGTGIAEADRSDADKSGIAAEGQCPAHLGTLEQESVVAQEAAEDRLRIDEIPGMEVFVVEGTEAGKKLSALELESSGDVHDFAEGLFQFAVPIAVAVLEPEVVGEALQIFSAQREPGFERLCGKRFALRVVAACGEVLRVSGGESTHPVDMEVGEKHVADVPIVEAFPRVR
jgi:hypothetical protein